MASIYKDIPIDAPPDTVWDAVRDFGAVHRRLNPGFVTDCRLDDNARIVTFHNGNVVREDFVDCDDARRRLAYAITGRERVSHYNGSVQVLGARNGEPAQRFRMIFTGSAAVITVQVFTIRRFAPPSAAFRAKYLAAAHVTPSARTVCAKFFRSTGIVCLRPLPSASL